MRRVRFVLPVVFSFLGAAALSAGAETTSYSLNTPPSALEVGCFGPCDCAVQVTPTYGSFDLVSQGSDPLYRYYSVERYIASFDKGPGAIAITGSGQYKIGGEVALTQQMTLDLQVQGGPVQHFDSGVVPVSAAFPKLRIECALHGFACHDSVVLVDASPIGTASVPPGSPNGGIEGIHPNPFGRTATILLNLDRPARVRVAVFGLDGRRIRRLGEVQLTGAGAQPLVWDGRRDDGRQAKAGVYWVRMDWPGGGDRQRIVKLN